MSDSEIEVNDFSFSKTADPDVAVVTNQQFSFAKLKRGRYACDGCSMKFYTKFLLNLHRVTRCSKLPYPCKTCDLRFSNQLNYKNHQKIHLIPQKKAVTIAREKIQAKFVKDGAETRNSQNATSKIQEDEEPRSKIPPVKDSDVKKSQKKTQAKVQEERSLSFRHHQRKPQKLEDSGAMKKTHEKFLKEEALSFIHRQKMQAKSVKVVDSNTKKDSKTNLKVLKVEDSDTVQCKKRVLKKEYAASSDARRNPERNARDVNLFTCETCHLTFPGVGKLERHMRVHSGKRAFQCRKCNLGFYWKSNYNRHVRTQCMMPENTYACVTCGRAFNRRFSLFRHRQTRHPEEDVYPEDQQQTNTSSQQDLKPPDGKYKRVKEEAYDEDTEVNSSDGLSDGGDTKSKRKGTVFYGNQSDIKVEHEEEREQEASKRRKKSNEKDKAAYYVNQSDVKVEPAQESEPDAAKRRRKKYKLVQRRYKCDVCHIRFRWKCDLNRHRTTHSDIKAYPCDQCELGFNWKSNLTRHQRRIHCGGEAAHRCDLCGYCFVKKYHLARHVNMYCAKRPDLLKKLQSDGLVKSEKGVAEVSGDPEGKREQEVAVKQETVSSPEEGEDTPEEILPDINQNVNIVYLHVCQNEGTVYNSERSCENIQSGVSKDSKKDIPVHVETEDGSCIPKSEIEEKDPKMLFVCSKCSRVFHRKTCHVQHERSHDRQPLKCRWCGRDFHRRSMLEKHERAHKGEKTFTCEFCSSHFRQKSQLMQHLKTHSTEKPFECEFCNCKFGRKGLLDRHRMIHTGERPYKCESCDLTFNQRCSLVLHQRVHAGEKPYRCGKCDLRFAQKISYDRHLERVHFSDSPPTKRNRTSHKTHDPHVYNTRFKADKVDQDKQDKIVEDIKCDVEEDTCVGIETNPYKKTIKCNLSDSKSASESKSGSEFVVGSDISELVRGDGPSKPGGSRSDAMLSDNNSDYFAPLAENGPCLQNSKGVGLSGVDQVRCPNKDARNPAEVFAKNLAPRKDISAYKSESINEFIKSYKRKNSAKGKIINRNLPLFYTRKDLGSPANSKGVMIRDAAADDSDHDMENIQNKKSRVKFNKSRSRRCSDEIEISEGLANFHIGLGGDIEINANGSREDCQTNNNSMTVESRSFSESTTDDNGRSYTKQGTYIFHDIITVESSLPNSNINIKCNENMAAQDENGKHQECGSINDKSESSDLIKKGETLHSEKSPQKSNIAKHITINDEFHFNKSHEANQELYERNKTPESNEIFFSTTDNTNCDCDSPGKSLINSSSKAIANEISRESVRIICVPESISDFNADQQCSQNTEGEMDKKWSMEHERIALIEQQSSPKRVPVNSNEAVNATESKALQNDTRLVHCAPDQKPSNANSSQIGVCKEEEEQDTISNAKDLIAPENEVKDNQKTSKLIDLSSKSILPIQEKDCYSNTGEIIHSQLGTDADVLKQKQESDNGSAILNNNDQCADEIDLAQKHHIQKDPSTNDVLSLEGNDLINEIHIDKDNDCICEMHADKNDCISGICTDNNDCISRICTDNDDCITEIYADNDRVSEIQSDQPDKCFRSVIVETSNDCSEQFEVNKSNNFFKETHRNEIDCTQEIHKTYNNPPKEIKIEKELQCVSNQCAVNSVTENCLGDQDINNSEASRSKIISKIISDRDLALTNAIRDNSNPVCILKEPVQTDAFVQFHNNQTFTRSDENLQFQYVNNNPTSSINENESNLIFHNQSVDKSVWKEMFNNGSNNTFQSSTVSREPVSQFELHTNNGHNGEEINTVYARADQHQQGKPLILNVDANTKQIVHMIHTDNGFPYQHEATWKEAQLKQYPIHRNFATGNNEIVTGYNPNLEASYHKRNQWNQHLKFQDGTEHNIQVPNENPSNFYVQDAPYETDIDEESIRYAVQTVQAIIQSEGPIRRESAPVQEIIRYETQSFQVPVQNDNTRYSIQGHCDGESVRVQAPVQEIIRYQTQNFQFPLPNDGYGTQGPCDRESVYVQAPVQEIFRYQTQSFQVPAQNDGYSVQGPYEGIQHNYQNFQSSSQYKDNIQHETIKYDSQNVENPFRYGYVDHNTVRNANIQRIHTSENGIDQDGRIVQLPVQNSHFPQFPDHHTEGFVRQNAILHREHDTAHFEEGFSGPKPMLDLVPVPYSSSLEPFSYERAPAGLSCVQNVQLAPYERLEVTKTVYTNLELASYGKPPADGAYIPYKEIFNDSGIMHKEQRSIVQYKDMYPYTSENMYTHPLRPQAIRTTEQVPNQASYHYEKSYTYPVSGEINVLHDSVSQVGTHGIQFENGVTYHNPYPNLHPNNITKEIQNSVVSQVSKGRKKVRRGRMPNILEPKKPRVRRRKKDCLESERQKDQGHQRCDRVPQVDFAIDLVSPKRAAGDQERQNPNERTVFNHDKNDSNSKICIGSSGNLSKDASQYSMHAINTGRCSEKSFECDKSRPSFTGKSDLIRHQFAKHHENRPSSSFPR